MKNVLQLNINKILISVMMLFGMFALSLSPAVVQADTKSEAQAGVNASGGDPKDAGNSGSEVTTVIKNVIGIISFLIGLVAVLMIVIAGFRFVMSNGDSGAVASARNTIIYAVIGIVVAVLAYAIVNFILDNIT